jgi:hypothetical protein
MEGERLLIEGTLKDERFFQSYFYSARKFVDPGVIHLITVRLTLSLPELVIVKAEARMDAVPNEICREVRDAVAKIEGVRIHRGFRTQVMKRMGGTAGCLHMANLVIAMASAAVQGQWAYYSRKREKEPVRAPKMDSSLLLDSCWLWRGDGPFYESILQREKDGKKER